jgi:hypothetical protein
VKKGDTLSALAKRLYVKGSLDTKIFDVNKGVLTNPALIRVGQKPRVLKGPRHRHRCLARPVTGWHANGAPRIAWSTDGALAVSADRTVPVDLPTPLDLGPHPPIG